LSLSIDKITVDDLPDIDLTNVDQLKQTVVNLVNSIPPYYHMYLGRDQTVPLKVSVLYPEAPQSK
jgi:oleate hydratase